MAQPNLFDFDFSLDLPAQDKFPLNLSAQGRRVRDIIVKDIKGSEDYLIITGFTSLANLIDIFGTEDYPKLKQLRVVIGFDLDERVSKKLPHYSLSTEIKNYWLKQNISIRLCGPILNIIEKIKAGGFDFRVKDRLHAKIYVGDNTVVLGSSNFSKSGIIYQSEANIRLDRVEDEKQHEQYKDARRIAEYYYGISENYNIELIELLRRLLKDVTWEEALARAIAEILESKWMRDYPVLYNALITHTLWPSQKIGIARAMKIIQDKGRVLLADPTGSGKTKFATALAYTLFHWLWENGLKERSNALIISPKQVVENWEKEQEHFRLYNKIESMGKLSMGSSKNQSALQRQLEAADILVVDEAHNYLHPGSARSRAINPKTATHVILSTATPINKKAEDLLRLIELLDIDNLSDQELSEFLELRKNRKRRIVDRQHLDKLRGYVNQFIVRRTKKELNAMIDREPEAYRNRFDNICRYPKTIAEVYPTGESLRDQEIAAEITQLITELKGIQYLQKLQIPSYIRNAEEKKAYIRQRFKSASALSAYMVRAALRSSDCALYEYLYGTTAACKKYEIKSIKNPSGDMVRKIKKHAEQLPVKYVTDDLLFDEHKWLYNETEYKGACSKEIKTYNTIGALISQLSSQREKQKANTLINCIKQFKKVLAFDGTIISLHYFKKILDEQLQYGQIIVATGQNKSSRNQVMEHFALGSNDDESIIALCSDAMSEGINLQGAKAMVLLDMPSVLRIIEQRIGRLERMDCVHNEVHVFWPGDSDIFSLNGDKRMIDILLVTGNLIGNNVEIPKAIYDRHLSTNIDALSYISAYNEFVASESEWEGVKDSTQYLYDLIEGKNALIDNKLYHEFKDVDATIKTAVSFVESELQWSFFAFRGSPKRSPKWLLIDEKNKLHTDFGEIAEKLRKYLDKKVIKQRRWEDVNTEDETKKIVRKLRSHEKELLPWKKKRALKIGKIILTQSIEKKIFTNTALQKAVLLVSLFDPDPDTGEFVDFDHFADLWLNILLPRLDALKKNVQRRRKLYTLEDLSIKNVKLEEKQLDWLIENCQYANTLEEMIAACIIGISSAEKDI